MQTPVDIDLIQSTLKRLDIHHPGQASIRELSSLVDELENSSGVRYIRMEMGVPGLPAADSGIQGEIVALKKGVAASYPPIQGVERLRHEGSRFVEAFLATRVPPRCILPTSGSAGASFVSFMTVCRRRPKRPEVLFLDPGFPLQKLQLQVLGLPQEGLDVYECRGERLGPALERILSRGRVGALLFSNPNNPAWICFSEKELRIIGELCTKYDVIALEDLAYLTMDFRSDSSRPFEPPYQPTVSRYTDSYMLLISSSKLFSFAGERIGLIAVSPTLFDSRSEHLRGFFNTDRFGHALVFGSAYAVSAGVNHSAQYGLASILEATTEQREPAVGRVREYGTRARQMKRIFLENGFRLVYDQDDGQPLADGFYFTLGYPGLSGDQLVAELLRYGVSAISLSRTGSFRPEGIRACVSQVQETDLDDLAQRIRLFHEHHTEQGITAGAN